jgi:LemA protein
MHFKNRIEMFPSNLIAGMFNFRPEPFFETEAAAERVAPQVKF